ncbi:MAG: ABC transporter ATP-binding protein [Bacteroidota bacterium]
MYCIETDLLSHRFPGGQQVLKGVALQVPEGAIYGFLGANGAGKTTTIRLLLGLLKKQEGSIRLFGQELEAHRISILRKVGALIESPSIYSHLSASENLQVLQKVYGCSKNRIGEVLRLTGLADTGKKSAGKFSLGMKQRLSLAMALLNEPRLLILDEPTNGLDPGGIMEMRELLKTLNRENGITILVSSHLLSEIEKLVSHLGIINNGKLIFQGTLATLAEQQHSGLAVEWSVSNTQQALALLASLGLQPVVKNERISLDPMPDSKIAAINRDLVSNGIDVYGIQTITGDLETTFMELIS